MTPRSLAIVTGASSGIGRAIALQLARSGYTVLAGVRQPAAERELAALGVSGLTPVILDVTADAPVAQLAERVGELSARGWELRALINNAALCVSSPLETVLPDALQEHFEVNVLGVNRVIQAVLPALIRARGRIVNIGSNVARVAPPFLGGYAASKAALEALTDVLRRELRSTGVHVSLVVPGPVLTPVWDKIAHSADIALANASAATRARYGRRLQRFVQMNHSTAARSRLSADDVARQVARALAARSPRARYEVGLGARAGTWISRALPTALLDVAFERALGAAPAEPVR